MKKWSQSILLFGFVAGILFILQSTPGFLDPDTWYHMKITQMMTRGDLIFESFPWLQFSVLKNGFVDHHFLYHVFLVPFVSVLGAPIAFKTVTGVFAFLFFVVLYGISRRMGIADAWLTIPLLLSSSSFLFRLNLAKAMPLVLIFLFLLFFVFLKKRYWWTLFFSMILVLTYGGWPILFLLVASAVVSSIMIEFFFSRTSFLDVLKKMLIEWRIGVGVVCLGILLGNLLHPYFPKTIYFYWLQVVEIGLINYRGVLPVGTEWNPTDILDVFVSNALIFFVFFFILGFFLYGVSSFKKFPTQRLPFLVFLSSFFLAAVFFLFTIKSNRAVELFVPWMVLATVAFTQMVRELGISYDQVFIHFLKRKRWLAIYTGIFLIAFFILSFQEVIGTYWKKSLPVHHFARAASWLIEHTSKDTIVFHARWDSFPFLWYHNDYNWYVSGLDPTFSYRYNPEEYWKYHRFLLKEPFADSSEWVQKTFHTSYAFVPKDQLPTLQHFVSNPQARKVYEDDEAVIFFFE